MTTPTPSSTPRRPGAAPTTRAATARRATYEHPDPVSRSRPDPSWQREARRRARAVVPPASASGPASGRRGASPWATAFGAMLAAGAIALTHGLPAYAVPDDVSGGAVAVHDPATGAIQTLQVDGAQYTVTSEQGFSSTPPPPPPVDTASEPGTATGAGVGAASPVVAGGDVRWPIPSSKRISSPFGPRASPCAGCSSDHRGLDFDPGRGAAIQSVARGVVRQVVSSNTGLGVHVVIDHEIGGTRISSTYAHMQAGSVPLRAGQLVEAGAPVGRVGTTGASTGPHLHFELAYGTRRIDPLPWLEAHVR
ncbi:M23 family metallopeptidase [Clavibacter zhangzhiyongii]|uniref:M23 family metallopeptidase n=1 Tax=Clavibacter zhangzhiyongii TaxID=2768071 RepID=UPI0039E1B647